MTDVSSPPPEQRACKKGDERTELAVFERAVRTEIELREQLAAALTERDDAIAKAEHNFAAYRDVLSVVQQTRAAFDALMSKHLAVEARVRAELAEQLGNQALKLRNEWRGQSQHGIGYVNGWEDAAGWLETLAAGSSRDTTPEAEEYPGQRSKPDACPVCHGPVEIEQLETGADPYWSTVVPGRWSCPKGCDPRTAKEKP